MHTWRSAPTHGSSHQSFGQSLPGQERSGGEACACSKSLLLGALLGGLLLEQSSTALLTRASVNFLPHRYGFNLPITYTMARGVVPIPTTFNSDTGWDVVHPPALA